MSPRQMALCCLWENIAVADNALCLDKALAFIHFQNCHNIMMPDSPLGRCCQESSSFSLSQSRNLKSTTVLYQCKFPEFPFSRKLDSGTGHQAVFKAVCQCMVLDFHVFPGGDYELWSCSSPCVSACGSLCLEHEVPFFSSACVWNRLQILRSRTPEHAFC